MAAKHWPGFMVDPEWQREIEQQEEDARLQEFEDEDVRRLNNQDPYAYFEERGAA